MKIRFISILLIVHGTTLTVSGRKENAITVNLLDKLNWSERNYAVLTQLIRDYGKGGKYYDENKSPYAIFDWDQTCAHFDVEEALMHYQIAHLRFKMTKEQFKDLLKDTINGVTRLSEAFHGLLLADINQDLIDDYNFLYDNFSGFNGTMNLPEIARTPQYNDFLVKIPFLYNGYCATDGIGGDYGYPWVLYLLAGHTIKEVSALAKEAISFELGNKLSRQTVESPSTFPTKAGKVSVSFTTGLRVFPEMQNLISTFQKEGIEVFIVSASYKPVVEMFSGIGNFGYNVPAENVIAMELETSADGKILPEYKTGWVQTFRQGKVEAINKVIKIGHYKAWDPLFSAGDSDGDFEMSTGFPDMKLSLIWNRVKGGDIGKLCSQAVGESNLTTPRYILQGRNENTGLAIPGSESILLENTVSQLVHP